MQWRYALQTGLLNEISSLATMYCQLFFFINVCAIINCLKKLNKGAKHCESSNVKGSQDCRAVTILRSWTLYKVFVK